MSESPHAGRSESGYERLVIEETLIADAQELIVSLMRHEGVTRSELARRLGKSKGFITHILSGERNLTLRTLADCAHALGYAPSVTVTALRRTQEGAT